MLEEVREIASNDLKVQGEMTFGEREKEGGEKERERERNLVLLRQHLLAYKSHKLDFPFANK